MTSMTERMARGGRLVAPAVALAWLVTSACNFDVSNPGPMIDANLDQQGTHAALVTGAERAIASGLSQFAHKGGATAREVQASGSTGFAGITLFEELGQLDPGKDGGGGAGFSNIHQARWVAEEAIRRMERTLGPAAQSYDQLARAYMWAGYANRILGENMCNAVYDGGKPEPYKSHFDRAITQFEKSIQIARRIGASARSIELASLAGRAAAYNYIGKNAEAEADAQAVIAGSSSFVFQISYYSTPSPVYTLAQALYDSSVRAISAWNTRFFQYYKDTGDPRAAYGYDATRPFGENKRVTYGDVPFYYPLKFYRPRTAEVYTRHIAPQPVNRALMENVPVNLASAREMRLILAEVKLRKGDLAGALADINALRTGLISETTRTQLALATGGSAADVYKALKRERGLELWMEGRRMGDLRRWREEKTPGDLDPLEYIPAALLAKYPDAKREQDVCFPIPRAERETNPNVPLNFAG